jgi:hypothetical protein
MAWWALGLLSLGVLLVVAGTGLGSAHVVRAGAGGVLGGSLLIAGQYGRMYARRNRSADR